MDQGEKYIPETTLSALPEPPVVVMHTKLLSWVNPLVGGALVAPPALGSSRGSKRPRIATPRSGTQFKALPAAPGVNKHSYFGECQRDALGHCLPKGSTEQQRRKGSGKGSRFGDDWHKPHDQAWVGLGKAGASPLDAFRKVMTNLHHLRKMMQQWKSHRMDARVSRLPGKVQNLAKGVWKTARVGSDDAARKYLDGQRLTEQLGQEKGLAPDPLARLRQILSAVDVSTCGPTHLDLTIAGVPAEASGTIPVGTLTYLIYSTAPDPLVVATRAKEAIHQAGVSPPSQAPDCQGVLRLLAQHLKESGGDDWFVALVLVGLDELGNLPAAVVAGWNVYRATAPRGGIAPPPEAPEVDSGALRRKALLISDILAGTFGEKRLCEFLHTKALSSSDSDEPKKPKPTTKPPPKPKSSPSTYDPEYELPPTPAAKPNKEPSSQGKLTKLPKPTPPQVGPSALQTTQKQTSLSSPYGEPINLSDISFGEPKGEYKPVSKPQAVKDPLAVLGQADATPEQIAQAEQALQALPDSELQKLHQQTIVSAVLDEPVKLTNLLDDDLQLELPEGWGEQQLNLPTKEQIAEVLAKSSYYHQEQIDYYAHSMAILLAEIQDGSASYLDMMKLPYPITFVAPLLGIQNVDKFKSKTDLAKAIVFKLTGKTQDQQTETSSKPDGGKASAQQPTLTTLPTKKQITQALVDHIGLHISFAQPYGESILNTLGKVASGESVKLDIAHNALEAIAPLFGIQATGELIDKEKLAEAIVSAIKAGKSVTKPSQSTASQTTDWAVDINKLDLSGFAGKFPGGVSENLFKNGLEELQGGTIDAAQFVSSYISVPDHLLIVGQAVGLPPSDTSTLPISYEEKIKYAKQIQRTLQALRKVRPSTTASPPVPPPPGFPPDETQLKALPSLADLGGHSGAQLVEWQGQKFVRKGDGGHPGQLTEEGHTNQVYRALGVPVPDTHVYDNGALQVSRYVENAVPIGRFLRDAPPELREKTLKQFQAGFALDCLLANWDVVGLAMENVLVGPDGVPWRVDNGGALRWRGMQGLKRVGNGVGTWGPEVHELKLMRNPHINPQAAEVFEGLSDAAIKEQVLGLLKNRETLLGQLPPDVRGTVEERLHWLRKKFNIKRPEAEGSIYSGKGKDWRAAPPTAQRAYSPTPEEVRSGGVFREFAPGDPRPPVHHEHYPPSLVAYMKEIHAGLTDTQRFQIREYSGTGSDTLNALMRECPETLDCLDDYPRKRQRWDEIDDAIAAAGKFATPITVWRNIGLTPRDEAGSQFLEVLEFALEHGEDVRVPGFKSTSLTPDNRWGGGTIKLEIRSRSGLWIEPLALEKDEKEVLLGHNVRYRVLGIYNEDRLHPTTDWGIPHVEKLVVLEEV